MAYDSDGSLMPERDLEAARLDEAHAWIRQVEEENNRLREQLQLKGGGRSQQNEPFRKNVRRTCLPSFLSLSLFVSFYPTDTKAMEESERSLLFLLLSLFCERTCTSLEQDSVPAREDYLDPSNHLAGFGNLPAGGGASMARRRKGKGDEGDEEQGHPTIAPNESNRWTEASLRNNQQVSRQRSEA